MTCRDDAKGEGWGGFTTTTPRRWSACPKDRMVYDNAQLAKCPRQVGSIHGLPGCVYARSTGAYYDVQVANGSTCLGRIRKHGPTLPVCPSSALPRAYREAIVAVSQLNRCCGARQSRSVRHPETVTNMHVSWCRGHPVLHTTLP